MGNLCRIYAVIMFVGCGSVHEATKDDAGVVGDAKLGVDAAVDAPSPPPQLPPTPSRETVGGAGRLTSSSFKLDAELGHPFGQQPAASANFRGEGNAAIKP